MKAVITGGTKGIGKALADKFLSEGYDIAICARGKSDIDKCIEAWSKAYPDREVIADVCDVSDQKAIEGWADKILSHWQSVDVLVNNAGIFIPGEILKEEAGALSQMIEVNLYSAYHLTRKIAPSMIEAKKGHIFNMCSVASIKAYPNGGSYSISKFALLGMSKVLREELKSTGVKVTSVLPGATWSASWAGVDLPEERLMQATDISDSIYGAVQLSASAVIEEIIIRPQLGDL